MNHLFVPYKIALALKEKGFDEECFAGYNIKNDRYLTYPATYSHNSTIAPRVYGPSCHQNEHIVKAPTYQQVIDWLYDKYKLIVGMEVWDKKNHKDMWVGYVRMSGMALEDISGGFTMYDQEERYEALEEAIMEAIKQI